MLAALRRIVKAREEKINKSGDIFEKLRELLDRVRKEVAPTDPDN